MLSAIHLHDDGTEIVRRPAKVRGVAWPQEYDLGLLIKNITRTHPLWSEETPACDWDSVQCDKNGNIDALLWHFKQLHGTVNWRYLPVTLAVLRLGINSLEGEVLWDSFPQKLHTISLSGNFFTGQPNLSMLPNSLKVLHMSANRFSGVVGLSNLPPHMNTLFMVDNQNLVIEAKKEDLPKTLLHLEW